MSSLMFQLEVILQNKCEDIYHIMKGAGILSRQKVKNTIAPRPIFLESWTS